MLEVLGGLVFFEVGVLVEIERVSAVEELEEENAEGVEIALYRKFTATRVHLRTGVGNRESGFELFDLRVIRLPEV